MVRSVFSVGEREGNIESFTPSGKGGRGEVLRENFREIFPDYNPEEFSLPKLTTSSQSARFFFKFAVLSPIVTYLACNCAPKGKFANIITAASIFALHIGRYL